MINRRQLVLGTSASATIAISFAAQWFLLTQLGASRQLDAYFAALAVPTVMLYVVADPLYRVAIPVLAVSPDQRFGEFAWGTLQLTGLFFGLVAVALGIAAPVWVPLLTPGFEPGQQRLAASLARWLLAGMVLQGLSGAARAVWNAKHRFVFPAIASALSAVVSLVFLILSVKRLGVVAAAWAFDLRFLAECVLLLPIMGWHAGGGALRPVARRLFRDARPLILGAAYARTDILVDRVLASIAPVGSLSLLYLAQQILSAVGQVLNQTFVAPASPVLAQIAHRHEWGNFRKALSSRAVRIGIIVLFVALCVPFSRPVLQLVFAHKNMDLAQIDRLTILLISLTGLLVGDSLGYLANIAFYSIGNTRTPAIVTGVVYSIIIPLKILVFAAVGIVGLAVCTSGYYIANVVVLAYFLNRNLRRISLGPPSGQPSVFQPSPAPEVLP
jgi:peptidoglycan biosynthesis protein MviN/MurJ (putative lipid II flippase)